mgnify:CR=1 FL=1
MADVLQAVVQAELHQQHRAVHLQLRSGALCSGADLGSGIRDHYLIHLVVSGKGVFEVGGRTYEVVPGDLFFARPSQLIRYTATKSSRGSTAGSASTVPAPTSLRRSCLSPTLLPSITPRTWRGCGRP